MNSETVTTNVGKKEFRAYLYWASFQSNIFSLVKIFVISAGLGFLLSFFLKKSTVFFLIWTAIIAVVYIGAIIISNEVQIFKIDKVKNFSYLNKTATYNFGDNGFTTSLEGKKFSYRKIYQLFATKTLLVINIEDKQCFLIRKADMTEGQLERITDIIKNKALEEKGE